MTNELTFKQKLANKFSDFKDDIHFLRRKDVSLRFKILNILSGDLLRNNLAFLGLRLHNIQQHPEWVEEDIKYALKDIEDIWKI